MKDGCSVACQLVDTQGNDPAKQYWSANNTIEVVGVKAGTKLQTLVNPGFFCREIHDMVASLCN